MPTARNAFNALPWSVMPWPTPPSSLRRSTRTTSTPRWASASDSTPPVMPPPTTRTRSTRGVWDSAMGDLLLGDGDGVGDRGRGGGDCGCHQVEHAADGVDLGREVEEAVEHPASDDRCTSTPAVAGPPT